MAKGRTSQATRVCHSLDYLLAAYLSVNMDMATGNFDHTLQADGFPIFTPYGTQMTRDGLMQ